MAFDTHGIDTVPLPELPAEDAELGLGLGGELRIVGMKINDGSFFDGPKCGSRYRGRWLLLGYLSLLLRLLLRGRSRGGDEA